MRVGRPGHEHDVLAGGGEQGALMRARDWSSTPVGPIESWPQSLRTALNILLASGYPMYVAWGPAYTQFYNDAFRPILGATKHPAALGGSTTETFAEIWDIIGPMFERVVDDAETLTQADAMMPLDRNGYIEECYFDFSYSPVRIESGEVGGVFVTCSETTERVLAERRLRTLRDLASAGADAPTAEDACRRVVDVLAANLADVPFALVYLQGDDGDPPRLVASTSPVLAASRPACPPLAELVPPAQQLVDTRMLFAEAVPPGAGLEPALSAIVLPLGPHGQRPIGVLIAGISPRRGLDAAYRTFFDLVAGQVSTAVGAARAHAAELERAEAERVRLQNVFMQAPAAICLLQGPSFRYDLANPLYCRLVGKQSRELLGRPLVEALPEMARQPFLDHLQQVRDTGERYVGVEALVRLDRRGDGELDDAYINFVYEPLRAADGSVDTIFVHAVEVTDQVRARQQAQAAEKVAHDEMDLVDHLYRVSMTLSAELELDTVVQAVTDAATVATGAQFGAFFYNVVDDRGESYTLYTISGVPRERFSSFPMPRNTAVFAPTFSGEGVVRIDDVTRDPRYGQNAPYHGMPKGHLPVCSYLAVPVVARSGEVLGGLFFGHSEPSKFAERAERLAVGIAAQAAVAIENARLYQQVQRAVRTRDEFLAAAAHDLKTPLASTKGLAQLLRRRVQRAGLPDMDRVVDGLDRINSTVDRMTTLIDELLDLGRLQMGQPLQLDREPTDLVALARQVVADQRPNAPRHYLVVDAPDEPLVGNWDTPRVRRALDNLLSNAVKYSPAGGEVRIEIDVEPGVAVIRVVDHGVGIPSGDLPHIFERFRRGGNVGLIQGTGIGLGVAQMIVEHHGGRIAVQSTEDAGTTFTVRLPLDPSEPMD